MSGFSNDNERPIIDRRPRNDEKPIIDRRPSSHNSSHSPVTPSTRTKTTHSGSSSNRTATYKQSSKTSASSQTVTLDDLFMDCMQTGSNTPSSSPATTGHSSANTSNNLTRGANSHLPKFLLVAVAVIAIIILIVFFTRDTSVKDFQKLLDTRDYEAAVALYNEDIAGDKEKEEEVYSSCELAILGIQESLCGGNISFDTALSYLNAFVSIENTSLAEQVHEALDDMNYISDGQARTNESLYADAISSYLLVSPEKPLYSVACTYIDTCVDQLISTAEDNASEDHLQAMLDVAGLLIVHQDFSSNVQEVEETAIRLTQKLAEEFAQNDNHQRAVVVVQHSRNVFADNQELDTMFSNYLLQYEQSVSAQVDGLVSNNDYASAHTLIDQVLAEYPDNQAFLNLQQSVVEKQAVYAKQVSDQVNSYVAAEDYTAAFDLIAQVRKADSENSVYEDLEQTTLKAYETFVSNQVQDLVGKNDYSSALSLIEQALKNHPNNQCFLELKTSVEEAKIAYEKKVSEYTNKEVDFVRHDASIASEDEVDTFKLTATVSGYYRFYVDNMVSGFEVNLYVYDDQDGELEGSQKYGLASGEGITVYLSSNHTYSIKVKQYSSTGEYRLNIGQPKPMVDISLCNTVYDSIQYTDQRNWYQFTSDVTGYYRFKLTNMVNGFEPNMYIYDDLDYVVAQQKYGIAINEGVTAYLEKGRTYEIAIRQYEGSGSYELVIGKQKPRSTLEENVNFTDEITFVDQINYYNFTPSKSGTYVFQLSGMQNSVEMNMFVIDSLNYTLGSNKYGVASGESITATLTAGETYTIEVTQYNGTGSYTLRAYYKTS